MITGCKIEIFNIPDLTTTQSLSTNLEINVTSYVYFSKAK